MVSWNLMSVLLTDMGISLKWITVTLKIETDQRHGINCLLEVFDGWEFKSDVHFLTDCVLA